MNSPMRRNLGLALIATIIVALPLLFLPSSQAKRDTHPAENAKRASTSAQTTKPLSFSDIFKSPAKPGHGATPVVVQAKGFAESAPVRDMTPTAKQRDSREKAKGIVRDRPFESGVGEEGGKEINKENREIIHHIDPTAPHTPDEALSYKEGGQRSPSVPQMLPAPAVSFDGITEADTETIGQGFLPPDTNGEVGPNHFVQSVNSAFRVWNKSGTPLTPVTSLATLFGPLGAPCGSSEDGDPVVLYDQLSDRWLISQFCIPSGNPDIGPFYELIAISRTGDPTGSYYLYSFQTPGTNIFPDYPHLGVWPDAYYMTVNQFTPTDFVGSGMYAFDRNKMVAGDPTASFVYFNSETVFPPGPIIGGMLPADLDGYALPPAGAPCPFAYFTANEFGDPAPANTDALRFFDFHVDFTTPANSTFTERAGSPLAVAAFDPVTIPADSRNVIPQPAPATATSYVDAINDRLMFRLSYRNFGNKETLVANHTVNATGTVATYRAGVRLYQLSRATPASNWSIDEQTTWAGASPADTEHRWMGSAAQNYLGDLALGFSVSSVATSPSVRYAAKLASDPAGGGLAQGEQTLVAGSSAQTSTSGRWGDYSDLTVDPSDDCSFWFTQEYVGGTTVWKTRIGKFSVRACTVSPRGSIQGTITNCQTGLPVPNALVKISGGSSRVTDASGNYNATVAPGTYTATVTGANYDTATSGSLVVSDGGSATFGACLNGTLKQPAADTVSVTADSCNSNGFIDPNETVTVNLGIKNTGTLNTVNLVATLQATGGVNSPGAPQTYGVVVANGPTASKPFTFTAGNLSCGSPLTLTLALQDGATNLGTVNYNLNTGQLLTSLYSTGNIAVAIPDNVPAGVDIPLTVADVMTLSDVNVSVRMNHTFVGDLRIDLVHPDNTSVNLVNLRGGSGANFGNGTNDCSGTPISFDDQAATSVSTITSSGAPYASTFKPEGSLAALNGKPSNGTWKLHVSDNANLDSGTVGCVKLELNRRFACCGALMVAAPPAIVTSESISPANNAPDPDETVTVNFPLINNGASATNNLVATLLPTGGVLNPSAPQSYGVVAGTGGTGTKAFTFTANGTCGNNITATLALQDGATNLGTVAFTIRLGTTASSAPQTFSNTAAITIPSATNTAGESSPYPSNITVSGLTGTVSKVTVTLNNLTHAFATDMDMLLVGPGGQKFIILSDAIRSGAVTAATYTLDDAAATLMPSSGPPASGTYRPANYSTGDTFPAPAPAGPYETPASAGTATFASVFNGTNPNGTWSLYVVDDFRSLDNGTLAGGWSVTITTAAPVCNTQACNIVMPANITVPATASCGAIVNYPLSFTGGCGTVTTSQASGTFFPIGTTTVNVTRTPGVGSPTTQSFTVTVTDTETQSTGTGSNVTNNYCNTSVKFNNVGTGGQTTIVNAPPQTLPPPYTACAGCPQLDISTTAAFTGPVTTCITMPNSIDFNTFSQLRLLHGEAATLVNRTSSSNFATKTLCATTNTLSPFVVAFDPGAPTAAPASISGRILTGDGQALGGVELALAGPVSKRTITDENGYYSFRDLAPDALYTVVPQRANYNFSPQQRTFSLLGNKTDVGFTATTDASSMANPLDTPMFFVRQQYLDFLGREPDEAGLSYWTDQLEGCRADAVCQRQRRKEISAAFFMSEEFQQSGSYVLRLYSAALGRRLSYAEFSADRVRIIGGPQLEANKQAFVSEWTQRAEFKQKYPDSLSNAEFVNRLYDTAGLAPFTLERERAIQQLGQGSTRAEVLSNVADTETFRQREYNGAFVLMEYFGYLKRDAEEGGYRFWLDVLNNRVAGNYRGMVCSFITSAEYQKRFGNVVTRSDSECE